eukprot:GHVS01001788.1.p1 GENE.GHVS01001788.1~~GHVS01001788.1.p1  ORF type:complete len:172 (+),score=21.57 GHVS01001788.1:62-517(+)
MSQFEKQMIDRQMARYSPKLPYLAQAQKLPFASEFGQGGVLGVAQQGAMGTMEQEYERLLPFSSFIISSGLSHKQGKINDNRADVLEIPASGIHGARIIEILPKGREKAIEVTMQGSSGKFVPAREIVEEIIPRIAESIEEERKQLRGGGL